MPNVPTTHPASARERAPARRQDELRVTLLSGGSDKPYVLGLTEALVSEGVHVDVIGSDELDVPAMQARALVTFRNLRGDQRESAPILVKTRRILAYYGRLMAYSAVSGSRLFHILWNNRFELLDRTALMLYYRACGKRLILTAHNVNAARRNNCDTVLNRWSLRVQYRLCDHVFVHTPAMKAELLTDFGVPEERVTVIPFGLNDTAPKTSLSRAGARAALNLDADHRVVLFFGQIAPYKGLEYLVDAFGTAAAADPALRLLIAGKIKRGSENYWDDVRTAIGASPVSDRIHVAARFIPDDEVERYFKAADVVALPYTAIYQSGLPFLAYAFGAPVVATDVGALRDDVVEGTTGFVCPPRNAEALARALGMFFESELYRDREHRRRMIREWVVERHSWAVVGKATRGVYEAVLAERTGSGEVEHAV